MRAIPLSERALSGYAEEQERDAQGVVSGRATALFVGRSSDIGLRIARLSALRAGTDAASHMTQALHGRVWQCLHPQKIVETDGEHTLTRLVRCRNCSQCRKQRLVTLTNEITREVLAAEATYFVTLTFRAAKHREVIRELVKGGRDVPLLDLPASGKLSDEQNKAVIERGNILAKYYKKDVQDYFKRLRKNTGGRFRYIVAPELHLGERRKHRLRGAAFGFPHFHILLFRISRGTRKPLNTKSIRAEWSFGITHARALDLADPDGVKDNARYIAEYVSKYSFGGRLMRSLSFGDGPSQT